MINSLIDAGHSQQAIGVVKSGSEPFNTQNTLLFLNFFHAEKICNAKTTKWLLLSSQ